VKAFIISSAFMNYSALLIMSWSFGNERRSSFSRLEHHEVFVLAPRTGVPFPSTGDPFAFYPAVLPNLIAW
jgi:hypothetical protein